MGIPHFPFLGYNRIYSMENGTMQKSEYVRVKTLSIEEGMALIISERQLPAKGRKTPVGGYDVHLTSPRLRIFAQHGPDCCLCGRKGTLFAVEYTRRAQANGYHVNMYGEGDVLMTKAGNKTTCRVCHDSGVVIK